MKKLHLRLYNEWEQSKLPLAGCSYRMYIETKIENCKNLGYINILTEILNEYC